ncbi:unnamed protein product [Schistocephalus solidus]|uniref:Uncharacterized protein n=1 Tax=Schistocephalus solidus TaxID=70667 RepID=A0A3P7C883_SCHSO|nr:unnamed protein product [Schistocephalus solidus]
MSALVGLILVLLGGATFGAGAIYARTNLILLTEANHLLPYVDYAVFAVVGATGLFAIIAFIVCAVSSGWNGKRCFEGSRKAFCGRCLNTTLLICLIFGIIFWTLLAALLAFPVTSMSLLLYRDIGPTRIFSRSRMGAEVTARPLRVSRQTSVDSDGQELLGNLPPYVQPRPPVQPIGLSVPEEHLRTLDRSPSPIPIPHDLILNFFKCSALAVDLSYYGTFAAYSGLKNLSSQ